MMICIPASIFSWDFSVQGTSVPTAAVGFNFFTEQGRITYGTAEFSVRKHGWLSGLWSLEGAGPTQVNARKTNPLLRIFEVQEGNKSFLLKAQIMSRRYEIFDGGRVIGAIRPAHPFTRRSTIDCGTEISEPGQLFCFWLAALTWRRAAQSSSNAS